MSPGELGTVPVSTKKANRLFGETLKLPVTVQPLLVKIGQPRFKLSLTVKKMGMAPPPDKAVGIIGHSRDCDGVVGRHASLPACLPALDRPI